MRDITEWPSIKQVAIRFGYSQQYIWQLVKSGRLAAVKTALGYLVDPDAVDAFETERANREAALERESDQEPHAAVRAG